MGTLLFLLFIFTILGLPIYFLLKWNSRLRQKKTLERSIIFPRKLPVWETVKGAYAVAWKYRDQYFRITWLWLLISLSVLTAYNYIILLLIPQHVNTTTPGAKISANALPDMSLLLTSLIGFIQQIFLVFVGASIAVAWHRLILRDEKTTLRYYLRCDAPVWKYFKFGIFFDALFFIPTLIFMLVSHLSATLSFFSVVLPIVLTIFIAVVTTRLFIVLPAKALEIENITLKDVWVRTDSNFWRISFGNFLSIIWIIPFSIMFNLSILTFTNGILSPFYSAFYSIFSLFITMPVMLAFLSLSFRYFIENRDVKTL